MRASGEEVSQASFGDDLYHCIIELERYSLHDLVLNKLEGGIPDRTSSVIVFDSDHLDSTETGNYIVFSDLDRVLIDEIHLREFSNRISLPVYFNIGFDSKAVLSRVDWSVKNKQGSAICNKTYSRDGEVAKVEYKEFVRRNNNEKERMLLVFENGRFSYYLSEKADYLTSRLADLLPFYIGGSIDELQQIVKSELFFLNGTNDTFQFTRVEGAEKSYLTIDYARDTNYRLISCDFEILNGMISTISIRMD